MHSDEPSARQNAPLSLYLKFINQTAVKVTKLFILKLSDFQKLSDLKKSRFFGQTSICLLGLNLPTLLDFNFPNLLGSTNFN